MMHWLPLLLVAFGAASAQEGRWCSRDDTASVQSSWSQGMGLDGNGDTAVTIKKATEFFLNLFSVHPEVRSLFANVNVDNPRSPEFQAHLLRVITGLDLCVNALSSDRTLEEITSHLAKQHEARPGVKAEYFKALRKFIDLNLPQLVDNLDFEAWDNCMTPIFNAITALLP